MKRMSARDYFSHLAITKEADSVQSLAQTLRQKALEQGIIIDETDESLVSVIREHFLDTFVSSLNSKKEKS